MAKRNDPKGLEHFLDEELQREAEAAVLLRSENIRLAAQVRKHEGLKHETRQLQRELASLRQHLEAKETLRQEPIVPYPIKPLASKRTSEAVAFLVNSDTHVEECVSEEMVNGLNAYNLDISRQRYQRFFQRGLRLIQMIERDIAIPRIVLLCGGDHISGSIHEDLVDINLLPPVDAALRAAEDITSGIDFLLGEKPDVMIDVICKTGNHGRMTPERRVSSEPGYSLERMMFETIRGRYLKNPRVSFLIDSAYHTYIDVHGYTIRFHHGHAIRYGGGIGGITVPVLKAIGNWETGRKADWDVFGHFHQYMVHRRFIANGSLIGYNAFALNIRAEYEPPSQTLFVVDKKRGRTWVEPIFVDKD